MGPVWTVIKLAATQIPWGRVIENIPAVVDMVNRAKARIRGGGAGPGSEQGSVEERLRVVEEENLRLGKALLEASETLQQQAKALEVLAARQKMLIFLAVLALLTAAAAFFR